MLKKRPFIRIILIFLLSLTGMILVFPLVRETYVSFLVGSGNRFMSAPAKNTLVKFKENKESKDLDVILYIGNTVRMKEDIKKAYYLVTKISTFYIAWIELALMISLILASPVPIIRKLIVLVSGFLLVHVIVFLKLLIQIYYICNHNPGLDIMVLSPAKLKWIDLLLDQFVDTVQPSLILVVILWMLITFRMNDYRKLMAAKG
jgi:hypothetical protein